MEVSDVFPKNLRDQRNKAGLTQKELADKVGVAQSHISQMESGVFQCSISVLAKISDALNCSSDDLIKRSE
jgi:predicted transcriptional regulator